MLIRPDKTTDWERIYVIHDAARLDELRLFSIEWFLLGELGSIELASDHYRELFQNLPNPA